MTHLDRRNIIVDHWLRRLRPLEMAVLLVYDRHAGADNRAWPSNDRIKAMVGHNQARHIRRARQTLASLELLRFVGRHPVHQSDVYEINAYVPAEMGGADSGHPAPKRGTLPRFRPYPCPDFAPLPCPDSGHRRRQGRRQEGDWRAPFISHRQTE